MSGDSQPGGCRLARELAAGNRESGFLEHVSSCPLCQELPRLAGLIGPRRTMTLVAAGRSSVEQIEAEIDRALDGGAATRGRYRFLEKLGRGGEGPVYRAIDEQTSLEVAIKFVPSGRLAGITNAIGIRHANVCVVHHTDLLLGARFILMEFVDGIGLRQALAGKLSADERFSIFEQICRGVEAIHAQGISHLDLKPDNVVLRAGRVAVVMDFGLSVKLPARGSREGTPPYASPEQLAEAPVSCTSDVHALGQMLAELFPSPDAQTAAVIRRATAPDPKHRYPDVSSLSRALEKPRTPVWYLSYLPPLGDRRLILLAVIALVLGVVLVAGVPAPPADSRPAWRSDLWGTETVSPAAWNVALNRSRHRLPAIETPHKFFACGQHPWELVDGITQHGNWEHGLAFMPPPTVKSPRYGCISYDLVKGGRCGQLEPDARLCRRNSSGAIEPLDARGRDIDRFSTEERKNIGKLYELEECGIRKVEVALDGEYAVQTVRLWHRGPENTPRYFTVEVLNSDDNSWQEVGGTAWALPPPASRHDTGAVAASAPTEVGFTPIKTRRVRVLVDTCSTLSDEDLQRYRDRDRNPEAVRAAPGIFWLYELEVYARLSRSQAWWRWLKDRLGD